MDVFTFLVIAALGIAVGWIGRIVVPIEKRAAPTPWRAQQYGSNPDPPQGDKPPPPPGPPGLEINDLRGETKQSIRDRQDYEVYMAGFTHGLAVGRSNV